MDDMDKDTEKEKLLKICETWIAAAKDSETIKHIFAVMDTLDGTKLQKYINEADEFLKGIKQIPNVKEIRDYVKQDREKVDGGLPLF